MARKAVLILFPGAIAYELATAAEILSKKLAVTVATPTGDDHVDASGLSYRAAASFSEVDPAECACILIAGGGLLSIKDNEPLNQLLRAADQRGVLLGAVCAGPIALAQAGVLVGHRYTQAGLYPESDAHVWDGAEWVQEPLVVSDNIVTAVPEAHIDFAIEVARRVGVYDDAEAEMRRAYYKGRYERDWSKVGAVAAVGR